MKTLGERLHAVMQELGIESHVALAKYCGVSDGLVSQWFSGQTKLGPKPLRALGKTHFNLDWIANGDLPKYRRESDIYSKPVAQSGGKIENFSNHTTQKAGEISNLAMEVARSFDRLDEPGKQLILRALGISAPLDADEIIRKHSIG